MTNHGRSEKHFKRGYTQGVFDLFHVGHLNLINHAKEYCDYLIVGVNSDDLTFSYKRKYPLISEEERCLIVSNIRSVDEAHIVDSLDKAEQYSRFHFDAIFIGDDWKGNTRWQQTETDLAVYGVDVVYLPYTKGICSTDLHAFIDKDADGQFKKTI